MRSHRFAAAFGCSLLAGCALPEPGSMVLAPAPPADWQAQALRVVRARGSSPLAPAPRDIGLTQPFTLGMSNVPGRNNVFRGVGQIGAAWAACARWTGTDIFQVASRRSALVILEFQGSPYAGGSRAANSPCDRLPDTAFHAATG